MKPALFLMSASLALVMPLASNAVADSIGEVEGARADERAGRALSRQQREKLRRYGGNDDGYYSGYRSDDDDGYGGYRGPPAGVYIGAGHDYYGYSGYRYGY